MKDLNLAFSKFRCKNLKNADKNFTIKWKYYPLGNFSEINKHSPEFKLNIYNIVEHDVSFFMDIGISVF